MICEGCEHYKEKTVYDDDWKDEYTVRECELGKCEKEGRDVSEEDEGHA